MNFSDFRIFRTFDTLPFKRLLLHIFQKTNNIEVVFVPEDVDGAREMVETIIFRVCISQGYPISDLCIQYRNVIPLNEFKSPLDYLTAD